MTQLQNPNEENNKNLAKEIDDAGMKQVAGGAITYPEDDPSYDGKPFRFKVGQSVEFITGVSVIFDYEFTDNCIIEHRGFNRFGQPCYLTKGINDPYIKDSWIDENRFQK